jgi:hypothetical protein
MASSVRELPLWCILQATGHSHHQAAPGRRHDRRSTSGWLHPHWCVPPRHRIVDESSGRLTVTPAAARRLWSEKLGRFCSCSLQTPSMRATMHSSPE